MDSYKLIRDNDNTVTDVDNIIVSGTSAIAPEYTNFPTGIKVSIGDPVFSTQTTGRRLLIQGSPPSDVLEKYGYLAVNNEYGNPGTHVITPPTWAKYVNVICIGAGGGGGGGGMYTQNAAPFPQPDYKNPGGGGGGGGAGAFSANNNPIEIGENVITITIGFGGSGGNNPAGNGGMGGNGGGTTFTLGNTLEISAPGGTGGMGGCQGYTSGDRDGSVGFFGLGGVSNISNNDNINGQNGSGGDQSAWPNWSCGANNGPARVSASQPGGQAPTVTNYPAPSGVYVDRGQGGASGAGSSYQSNPPGQPGLAGQPGYVRIFWLYDEPLPSS
jgi:hypothetical protein